MGTSLAMRDIRRMEQLYVAGFQGAFLDNALRKVIDRQIARDEADLKRVEQAMARFEHQYGLSSDEFWQRFQAGQMDDTADFMEWNVFCKMHQRLISRLRILRGDVVHE